MLVILELILPWFNGSKEAEVGDLSEDLHLQAKENHDGCEKKREKFKRKYKGMTLGTHGPVKNERRAGRGVVANGEKSDAR